MSAEQVAKLRSELDVVQTNLQVFGEMLVTLQPGEEDPQDLELLRVRSFPSTILLHPHLSRNCITLAHKCNRELLIYSRKYPWMISLVRPFDSLSRFDIPYSSRSSSIQ